VSSTATGAIAERYSTALFELADQSASLDMVASNLVALKGLIGESADLRRLLSSPAIGRVEQSAAIVAVAERAAFAPLTAKFLGLLATNRRLQAVLAVSEAFLAKLAAKRGIVAAHVVSATPLDPAHVGAIGEVLKTAVGHDVTLDVTVDPSLLGGIVVKIGSRMFDASLKTKLQHLTLALKGDG
jgi:F-type H+-transporting ATPase subunit delta